MVKIAGTDMRYFARIQSSRNQIHKKNEDGSSTAATSGNR